LEQDCGVIISYPEKAAENIVKTLRNTHCPHYICISDQTLASAARRMRPRTRDELFIEVNLTDHCNLNCQMCDHFSQLSQPRFLDIETFERDMARLAELTNGHIMKILLLGGEPLLHKEVCKFIEVARRHFPRADLRLYTNGILLVNPEMENVWQCVKDNCAAVTITNYPDVTDIEKIQMIATEFDIHLEVANPGRKSSAKYVLDLDKNIENYRFISCGQFNRCTTLRDGKLFPCPMSAHIDIFNEYFSKNLEVMEADYIDIFKANSYFEVADFLSKPVPFCRYCAVHQRTRYEWKTSTKNIEEYVLTDV
jgi:MoaA/NifB/PqqE/SkfB family radical SAM enzyme